MADAGNPTARHLSLVERREQALRALLEEEIWPSLPSGMRGKAPSQSEQDEILGYELPLT